MDEVPEAKSFSIMSFLVTLNKVYSMIKAQANFFAKIFVCAEIYRSSILEGNEDKIDYKWAYLLGTQSLCSSYLLTYSSIMNLKYRMNHYNSQK